jgi:NAD(P)-dependent dehydrogenase (short-subunit alcohol dehydrogenase family)
MDKVLLVTGGARGIGAATARLAAERGYAVAVNYRERGDRADALVRDLEAGGARAIAVQADVALEREVERMFEEVDQRLGRLTHLVNSAGVSDRAAGPVAELRASELERLMAVNVVGLMLCCREAVRRMSTARGGQGGAIVNVSSMAAAS